MSLVKQLGHVLRAVAAPTVVLSTGALVMGMGACATDAHSGAGISPTGTLGGASGHAIHVFAKAPDGSKKQLDFGPGTEIHGRTKTKPTSGSLVTQDLHLTDFDGGGTALQPVPTVGSPGADIQQTAWMLVERASLYCSQLSGPAGVGRAVAMGAVPWAQQGEDYNWFIYGPTAGDVGEVGSDIPGASCSERLQYEENLLCIADQLGAIADAVGTTVWPALSAPPTNSPSCPSTLEYASDAGPATSDPGQLGTYPWECYADAEWDIPPQADQDRFIVRDLAIHALGVLTTLDATPVPGCPTTTSGETGPCTCTSLFADVAEVGSTDVTNTTPLSPVPISIDATAAGNQWSQQVFGVPSSGCSPNPPGACYPTYPPSNVPIWDPTANVSNAPTIARSALQIEGQILRAGGRLLHDLVRSDVYSDLAAAAKQAAQALDPNTGNQIAWGQSPQGPYGTYAHAARVLTGRWEVGDDPTAFDGHGDPMCEGQTALNVMAPGSGLFGDELSARVQDVQIRTKGEALAADIVGGTGIVAPSCSLSQASASSLRAALVNQLVLGEQVANGLSSPPPSTPFQATVAQLSDAEVLFGYQYALLTYRLMTDSADEPAGSTSCTPLPTEVAGLHGVPGSAVDPSVTSLQGVVIAGGLPRSRLLTEPLARSGGLLEASACPTNTNAWTEWGTTTTLPTTFESLPASVFQDAFHMGQSFERRLVELQIASTPVAGSDPGDPQSVARGAIAELRNWAGSMLVQSYGASSGPGLAVRISGEDFADFGLSGASDPNLQSAIESSFGFVYGPPWMAECAAQARQDCPANFDPWTPSGGGTSQLAGWVQHPTAVSVDAPDSTRLVDDNYLYGAVPPVFTLSIPYYLTDAGRSLNFNPPQAGAPAGNSHLYMVRLHDPKNPGARGEVLGVIRPTFVIIARHAPRLSTNVSSFVVAPMQRELLEDTIDLGKWVGARPPGIGDLTAANSPGYCVDGVPRDIFVPLQNQLTSGDVSQSFENSWQYYLNAAQQAATTADGLAQQLISLDLQVAQNEQAAGEQVANLCGDYGALSQVSIDPSGHETPAPNDATLNQCLNSPATDIVFLSNVPSGLLHGQPPPAPNTPVVASGSDLQWIQKYVLQCGGTNTDPLCSPNVTQISYNWLGIVPPATPAGPNQACAQLTAVEASKATSFKGTQFLSILKDPSFGTSSMQALAASLKMNVDLFDNWEVTYGGVAIMGSASGNKELWPGCLATGTGCDVNNPMIETLSGAFRYCPGLSPAQTFYAPLGCDGIVAPVYPPQGDNGSQTTPAVAELNVLRWRVAGALQLIAASAGEMPQQMFNMPIPASLLQMENYGYNGTGLFVGAVYPGGGWGPATGSNRLVQDSSSGQTLQGWMALADSNDATSLNVAYDVAAAFRSFTQSASNEIPAWYLAIYNPYDNNQDVMHSWAGNAGVAWTNCDVSSALGVSACSTPPSGPTPISLAQVVGNSAPTLDGVQCASRWGGWTNSKSGSTPSYLPNLDTMVSAFKTGYDTSWVASPGLLINDCSWGGIDTGFNCVSSDWGQAGAEPLWQMATGTQDYNLYSAVCPNTAQSGPYCTAVAVHSAVAMPPPDRVMAFVNMVGENGECNALSQLLDAAAVVCSTQSVAVQQAAAVTASPPQITSMADVIALQAWLGQLSGAVGLAASSLYTEHVPNQVVADLRSGNTGSGNKSGQVGSDMLTVEQALQDVPSAWARIASDINTVNSAIQSARTAIQIAGLKDEDALEQLALQDIQIQSQMMQSVSSMITSVINWVAVAAAVAGTDGAALPLIGATTGAGGALGSLSNGGVALDAATQELDNISSQVKTVNELQAAEVGQALTTLNSTTSPLWADIQTSLDNLRKDVIATQQATSQLQVAQQQASYQAAIAAGNDTVVIAGQEVPIPVNTVLNRQLSATAIRYKTALTNAKALSYMARRAIEQRIGIPLNAITTPVGALAPPASWADDVCSLTGINYQTLATPTSSANGGQTGATEQQVVTQFADSFVGDYVTKLQNFVTYFNVQYPSHEGNDTAILSLRYDLMPQVPECTSTAPNLLYYSGDLSHLNATAGWQEAPCNPATGKCLVALTGAVLPQPDGPSGAHQNPASGTSAFFSDIGNGVTWLMDAAQSSNTAGDAGPPGDGGAPEGGTVAQGPAGLVYQPVSLAVGSYVLSWWDQARDSSGNLFAASEGGAPLPYVVHVYDSGWNEVATYNQPPFVGQVDAGSPAWSARLTLTFPVTQPGTYYVAFGASTQDEGLGSVAIADVQLEASLGNGQPSVYVQTGDTRTVTAYGCTPSDSDMRAAFQHNCDSNGNCWYDLTTPIVLDTQQLQNGTSPISGKLAPGNFNFRHVDLAVNLVGTGVHDCTSSPTPDCYGSAYIQYTLAHDGTSAGILDWNGNSRVFDFGVASINSAKALAAERYITLPIGSADQALLSQSGIQHVELRGRPLDGAYTLRIWDSPALNWNNLQDVQIVLDYLYWSEIIANGNAQGQ